MTSELVLQDVRVASSCMLPGVKGLRGPLSALNEARFGIIFGVVGAAMACYSRRWSTRRLREQFGRPIGGFQLTQDKLVDALQGDRQAQLVAYQLGRLKDAGRLRPTQVSLGKRANVSMALEVARSMRSVLGATGSASSTRSSATWSTSSRSLRTKARTRSTRLVVGADITGLSAYT